MIYKNYKDFKLNELKSSTYRSYADKIRKYDRSGAYSANKRADIQDVYGDPNYKPDKVEFTRFGGLGAYDSKYEGDWITVKEGDEYRDGILSGLEVVEYDEEDGILVMQITSDTIGDDFGDVFELKIDREGVLDFKSSVSDYYKFDEDNLVKFKEMVIYSISIDNGLVDELLDWGISITELSSDFNVLSFKNENSILYNKPLKNPIKNEFNGIFYYIYDLENEVFKNDYYGFKTKFGVDIEQLNESDSELEFGVMCHGAEILPEISIKIDISGDVNILDIELIKELELKNMSGVSYISKKGVMKFASRRDINNFLKYIKFEIAEILGYSDFNFKLGDNIRKYYK